MSRKRIDGTTPAKKGAGIRWTLFAYLAVFCVAVLLLIWLVQGFLLNRIYYGIQLGRMDTAAAAFSTVSMLVNKAACARYPSSVTSSPAFAS